MRHRIFRRLMRRTTPAAAGMGLLLSVAVLGAGPGGAPPASATRDRGWVLQVEDATGWRTWWRSDSAPATWPAPVQAVLDATRWQRVADGVDLGELIVSGGSLALRTRVILARFDPRRNRMILAQSRYSGVRRSFWTVDSADSRAVLAFNAGQFTAAGAWGWLVHQGREVQPTGVGPLSLVVAMMTDGETRFVSPESVSTLRAGGRVREAFQSYPALLVDDGRVPDLLRNPGRLVDLGHRDTRFVMCALGDGALIVALTRFDNLGRVFGGLPIGLTLDETAALMGALGCRQAVSLDGGLSAQLLVRPEEGPVRRWEGMRKVPLGIEVLPRQ